MKNQWISTLTAAITLCIATANDKPNPVEVGIVKWQRNYAESLTQAQKSNKPIFALFQEVPG